MHKIALGIEYDGSSYYGWQKQKNMFSVQECIEDVLYKITSERVNIYCAGRTDTGVHAIGQVIHFETSMRYSWSTWMFSINRYLPSNICVCWVILVNKDFHARLSAISRRYCYVIYNHFVRSAVLFRKAWHYNKFLDVYKMSAAGQYLLGRHDFSVFRASGCQSNSTKREIYHLRIIRKGRCIIIDIKANAFMYHMVRNIVGSLVDVGCGKQPVTWISGLLKHSDRSLAGITAPAHGLYLVEIEYPGYFFIPSVCVENFWR